MPLVAQIVNIARYVEVTKVPQVTQNTWNIAYPHQKLDSVYSWALENNTYFNAGKLQAIHYQHANPSGVYTLYSGSEGTAILVSESRPKLDPNINNDPSYQVHIANLVITFRQLSGWTLRSFKTRDKDTRMVLWESYILSCFNYSS